MTICILSVQQGVAVRRSYVYLYLHVYIYIYKTVRYLQYTVVFISYVCKICNILGRMVRVVLTCTVRELKKHFSIVMITINTVIAK
jgi:hypothetical protein